MPRKRRTSTPDLVGMTPKQMKRKKPINSSTFVSVEPITENQKKMVADYDSGKHLFTYGCAGTGKTFMALYLALRDVLDENTPYDKVYIVRSLVATREIGFLPGTHEDKADIYQIPYKNMVRYMFEMPDDASFDMLYENLKHQETISFWSTSFLRGTTLDNSIVIVDESQNLHFHELDTIMTRVGQDSRIIFCGDASQSDLIKATDRTGIIDFQRILQTMDEFSLIEYGIEDIVRSGIIKSYIIAKINLGI